jgi:sulfur carrier protein
MPHPTINIILNGNPQAIAAPITLAALLESLGLAAMPVVVELNSVAVLPREYATTLVPEGACLEVVTLAAGG